jgi:gliding motility-associated-like protein
MRNLFVLLIVSAGLAQSISAQVCNIDVTPMTATICPGDSVFLEATASITSTGQSFNFDFGTLPPGWSTTGGQSYSQPCGANPSGTNYYWASTAGTGTPTIGTPAFDVSCGGQIVFDMVYSVQSGGTPCEGPDLAHEGVELQYSNDGGITWIPIIYYSPGGYTLPSNPGTTGSVVSFPYTTPYTSWGTFTVDIPPGAITSGTMFQWIQENSSGSLFDNWGLDNISVQAGPCNSAVVNWSNGYLDTNSFWAVPTADTAFVAYVYDTLGNFQCMSDTIFIDVYEADLTYNLVDTVYAYCPTDIISVEVTNFANAIPPYATSWSTGSTTNPTDLPTNGNKQETIVYYVEITDGCGFVYPDSVVMVVNQTLAIDTMLSFPSSACLPTGAASGFASGLTTVLGQPYYNWTGPGNPGTFDVDASVITDVPTGWYYFTVTDDVCTETDSVFIDIENPPVANLSANITSGCTPVSVTFTNSSQNTTSYEWDFGNGNSYTVNNAASQNETFTNSSVVMLVAFDNNNCSDTAYVAIQVIPCGCTSPNAINYNPLATIDDGSCIFPEPTVFVPNVFTPNGDGDNDLFVLTTTNATNIELTILNRWGNVMYEASGLNPAWDGKTADGNNANEGTYFHKYRVEGYEGVFLEGHGFLQLIRD